MLKTCNNCLIEQPLENFHKDKTKQGGYRQRCKACVKLYMQQNRTHINEVNKQWRRNNKEKLQPREHNQKRKQQKKDAVKRLQERNPRYFADYQKLKRASDVEYTIALNLRRRINSALKGETKAGSSATLLGCTLKEFKNYLEKLFQPTMGWENYGSTWHLDHIKPCAAFNLTDPEEQKLCFHYTNIQPLFATSRVIDGVYYQGNLNKGKRYTKPD